jgi:hypothetical protein
MFDGKWLHHHYIAMSQESPLNYDIAPFCWRVFLPLIAYILPFDPLYTYLLVSFISLWCMSILIFIIFKSYGLSWQYALVGSFLFLSTVWLTRYGLIEFWDINSLAYLVIIIGIYLIRNNNLVGFLILVGIGSLIKETTLFLIPLYYTMNQKKFVGKKTELLLKTAFFSFIPIFIFIFLRLNINPTNDYNFFTELYNSIIHRFETFIGFKSTLNYELIDNQGQVITAMINVYRLTFGALGVLAIFPVFNWKQNHPIFKEYLPLIVLSFVQLLFAGDNERLVVFAVFPLILMTVNSFRLLENKSKIPSNYFYIFTFVLYILPIILSSTFYHQTYYSVVIQLLAGILFILYIGVKYYFVNRLTAD